MKMETIKSDESIRGKELELFITNEIRSKATKKRSISPREHYVSNGLWSTNQIILFIPRLFSFRSHEDSV